MNSKKLYTIYMHVSPSGKKYIGATCRKMSERWKNGGGYKTQKFFEAIKKYGWDNFEHIILENDLEKDVALEREIYYISKYKTNEKEFGYNVSSGGLGCLGLYGDKNPNYGKKWSSKQKQHMSFLKTGAKQTKEQSVRHSNYMKHRWENQEYRNSMSGENAPCYGRTGKKHPLYGKKGSENANSKKVLCVETGAIYVSATEAAQKTGFNHSKICMVCRGERKSCGKDSSGNPFHWRWV